MFPLLTFSLKQAQGWREVQMTMRKLALHPPEAEDLGKEQAEIPYSQFAKSSLPLGYSISETF